jgi:hypothetical protein
MVEMLQVASSNLVSVGYDPQIQKLYAGFKRGELYEYDAVPQYVFDELKDAVSIGTYFQIYVKNCYSYRRLR